jgi:hypothetical protein
MMKEWSFLRRRNEDATQAAVDMSMDACCSGPYLVLTNDGLEWMRAVLQGIG